MAGWIHANQHRTDGQISREDLAILAGSLKLTHLEAEDAAAQLVKVELWQRSHDATFTIRGYLDWCHDAATIKRKTAEALERTHRSRAKKGSPDPSKETEATEVKEPNRTQQERSQERNASRNALQDQDEGLKSDNVSLHLETDGLYNPTPEDIKRGKEAAERNRRIAEEKLHLPVGSAA